MKIIEKPNFCPKCGGRVYDALFTALEPPYEVEIGDVITKSNGDNYIFVGKGSTSNMNHWRCAKCGETFVQDIEGLCIDEVDEKLSLYQRILELEDLLEIKHNPHILKEVWDTMNDYSCELERILDEIAYSELEEANKESSNVDDEKKHQIAESYKELEDNLISLFNKLKEKKDER